MEKEQEERLSKGVVKSPYDSKEYRAVHLENGVTALLISDPRRTGKQQGSGKKKSKNGRPKKEREDTVSLSSSSSSSEEQSSSDSLESGSDDDSDSDGGHGSISEDGGDMKDETSLIQSACAVCVNSGSFFDPPEVAGLAHLLEHMVFMGSKKYPGENTLDSYVNRHGGHTNASTDYERTVYEFCVQHRYFREALDMFAHMFATPLLLESSLNREIEAVDSEFQMSTQSDADRIHQLLCFLANSEHPFSKFVWGNNYSLKKGPRKAGVKVVKKLREFQQKMYSSHYVTVAVMSCDTLDILEKWTRESFSAIPHNQLPRPVVPENLPPFDSAKFNKLYKVVPVKDMHEVHLTWLLPKMYDHYRTKPLHYLGWLLGHEGKGSVLSYLKKRNLATVLCAGNSGLGYEYNSSFSLFTCTIRLTDKGFDQVSECVSLVFQYLKLLQSVGPQETVFKEIQRIEENEFNFKEEDEPVDFVQCVCESMQLYPEEDYLTGDDLMFDYKPDVIASVQDSLTPDNVNIMWLSKKFSSECQLKEKWFGTMYSTQDIPSDWKERWQKLELNPDLHLPRPNVFIATEFSFKDGDLPPTKHPVVIDESEKLKLWYKKDVKFKTPRAWICLLFKTSIHLFSPNNAALMDLFINLYDHNICELGYEAEVAQLEYSTDSFRRGVTLTINGLNHKLPLLFRGLIDHLATFSTTLENFDMIKEQLKKKYSNSILKPKKLCKMSRLKVLELGYWNTLDKMTVIENTTLESLNEFVGSFKKHLFVECLVEGNITGQEAKEMMEYLMTRMEFSPPLPTLQVQPRVLQLPAYTIVNYRVANLNPQSPNTVITDYYQCCVKSVHHSAMASLLTSCMQEPCFDVLRTKQQLGYEVYVSDHDTHGVVGLSLTLVTQCGVDHASSCMDDFVKGFVEVMNSWSTEEFQTQVDSLIHERLEPDISLEEEVLRNWTEILTQQYHFERLEAEAEELRKVTQLYACSWLQKHTHPGSSYRKLSVKVVSHHTPGVNSSSSSRSSRSDSTRDTATAVVENGPSVIVGETSVDLPVAVVNIGVEGEQDVDGFKNTLFAYPSSCSSSS